MALGKKRATQPRWGWNPFRFSRDTLVVCLRRHSCEFVQGPWGDQGLVFLLIAGRFDALLDEALVALFYGMENPGSRLCREPSYDLIHRVGCRSPSFERPKACPERSRREGARKVATGRGA